MSPLLTTFASASARGWFPGSAPSLGALEQISTTILGSTTASVTFSSIPSTYSHLQIRMVGRSANGSAQGQMFLTFNGSATGYAYHYVGGNGSSAYSGAATAQTAISLNYAPGSTATANTFSPAILDILDYTNTSKNKTIRFLQGQADSSLNISLNSGLWVSTSAITSITISATGSFVSGSRFSLYGIKG